MSQEVGVKFVCDSSTTAYEIIEDAVREYWKKEYPQDVVAFFMMKYEHEEAWQWYGELAECVSPNNYNDIIFLNDFCEGQTCCKNVVIVPLQTVIDYYLSKVVWYEIGKIDVE